MPKPIWKGSVGIVEGGVTFTIAGGGAARRPERPRITNDEDARIAAREQAEALTKAQAAAAQAQSEAATATDQSAAEGKTKLKGAAAGQGEGAQ